MDSKCLMLPSKAANKNRWIDRASALVRVGAIGAIIITGLSMMHHDAATEHDVATIVTTAAASPLAPVSPPLCTKTLPAGGDLAAFSISLAPGDVACLALGAVYVVDTIYMEVGGTAAQPIILTSADPATPATIRGRLVTNPGANYITISDLRLDGINVNNWPSITIGSDHITLMHNDVMNEHTAVCINTINDLIYGIAHDTLIDANRIHDCGALPATNLQHGLYLMGYRATVTNNYIYNNADRGVQLRGSQDSVIEHNVIDGNGEGVIFGDLSASMNKVAYNVISNSRLRFNAESWWTSVPVGTGNTLHDNCFWSTRTDAYGSGGGVAPKLSGVVVGTKTVAAPLYMNPSTGDYRLQTGSACASYGPAGHPGP